MDAESRRRGIGDPTPDREAQIEIKRDGCDYLYLEIYPSNAPGAWLFARISPEGKVLSVLLGE